MGYGKLLGITVCIYLIVVFRAFLIWVKHSYEKDSFFYWFGEYWFDETKSFPWKLGIAALEVVGLYLILLIFGPR